MCLDATPGPAVAAAAAAAAVGAAAVCAVFFFSPRVNTMMDGAAGIWRASLAAGECFARGAV